MSRVGKLPVEIRSGVEVKIADGVVRVNGPKGTLEQRVVPRTRIEVQGNSIQVLRDSDEKRARAAHGLMRSLVNNMVTGVTDGFQKNLEIVGVGYRAEVKGKQVHISVGYSQPVVMEIPKEIEAVSESPTRLVVRGADKQKVGHFAAEIRRVRKPEPYKGKGIRYANERVRRKVGKAGVGG
jgi:large subunit ribosomal protein L6